MMVRDTMPRRGADVKGTEPALRGTPPELTEAAGVGTRLAIKSRRAAGQDDETIRREILARFRAEFSADGYGELEDETLMAVVQRALDEALGIGPRTQAMDRLTE